MKYDTAELTVTAGKKIKLIFANPDFMPHNIVLVNPGKLEAAPTKPGDYPYVCTFPGHLLMRGMLRVKL